MDGLFLFSFWAALACLVYVYAGFPVLVALVGGLRGRRVRKQFIEPSVSLIIAAYNEEKVIAARIENALALHYSQDKLEILVASDGSTDSTEPIVQTFAGHGVRLLRFPRRGKIGALNEAVRYAQGDVLVFSDANSMFQPDALRALVQNFADAKVGGVAGHTVYAIESHAESSAHGENLYWNYDTWLKKLESSSGSIVSAHGGIYAIRRELFQPVADPSVTDDFAISTAVVEQGARLVFEPEALSCETAVPRATREFSRRVRLMTRGMRSLLLRRRLLNPFRYGFYSVVLFTHKVLRRLLPFALVALFLTCLALSSQHGYAFAAAGQAAFYALAAAGWALKGTAAGRKKYFVIPFFYCFANAASLVAIVNLFLGKRIAFWQPQRNEART